MERDNLYDIIEKQEEREAEMIAEAIKRAVSKEGKEKYKIFEEHLKEE